MKRSSPLKPSKILPRRELSRSTPLVAKSPMKKSARPKMTAPRKFAKGKDCTLCLPGCPNATETTVLCHLRQFSGGGMGIKPWDGEAILADDWCHSRLDGRVPWIKDAPEGFDLWEHIAWAIVRTHRAMHAAGVLILKGESE
jgi:hypothetical protein